MTQAISLRVASARGRKFCSHLATSELKSIMTRVKEPAARKKDGERAMSTISGIYGGGSGKVARVATVAAHATGGFSGIGIDNRDGHGNGHMKDCRAQSRQLGSPVEGLAMEGTRKQTRRPLNKPVTIPQLQAMRRPK